jgi:hypothetical protein
MTATTDLILAPITAPTSVIIVSAQLQRDVATLENRLGDAPPITDQASLDLVRSITADAQSLLRQVETQRKVTQAPFQKIIDQIRDAARPVTTRLEEIKAEGKHQMEAAIQERDRRLREEEAARLAAEAAARAAAVVENRPTPALVPISVTPALQAPLTKHRDVVVVNAALVPDEFWVIDHTKLRAAALAADTAGSSIPGVEVRVLHGVAAR